VIAKHGDVFEISAPEFGRPLRNSLKKSSQMEDPDLVR